MTQPWRDHGISMMAVPRIAKPSFAPMPQAESLLEAEPAHFAIDMGIQLAGGCQVAIGVSRPAEFSARERAQIECIRLFGIELDRRVEVAVGRRILGELIVGDAAKVIGVSVFRIDPDGGAEILDRLSLHASREVDVA